ncbi:hypothetical protein M9Y10_022062 [Tritrichomonas musculus]|uniref:Borealin N-terminal domain-containing protein n=1 Tax=Tritrichomonas musculus TaxID=1915356 RepID=A0ABR2KRT8_9EUKA
MNDGDREANSLIVEFDQEVEKRCKMIISNAENTSDNMLNALGLILGSIPDCVRQMPLKALVQNFNGDIQAAAAYFAPNVQTMSKSQKIGSPKKGKKNLPLTQVMSLSDLLKHQAAGLPPVPRTPTKNNSNNNIRTPTRTKAIGSPKSQSKIGSPVRTNRPTPRTPTHQVAKKLF